MRFVKLDVSYAMEELKSFQNWLRKRGRVRSAKQYGKVVRRWLLNPVEVEEAVISSSYSPTYRRHIVACIRAWAFFTEDEELKARLGDIKLPVPLPRGVREPLSLKNWLVVRKEIDGANYLSSVKRLVCGMIALRGIRCGDVLRLRRRDVTDAVTQGVLVFESKGERWLRYNAEPLRSHLEGLLREWRGKEERVRNLVCPRSKESNCQETAGREIRRAFDLVAERVNMDPVDLFAHRFRHTYSTHFLQHMEGDPEAILKLRDQMGWSRLDTAANYLRRSRRKELDEVESRMLSNERE